MNENDLVNLVADAIQKHMANNQTTIGSGTGIPYPTKLNDPNLSQDERGKLKEAYINALLGTNQARWDGVEKGRVREEVNVVLAQLGYRS